MGYTDYANCILCRSVYVFLAAGETARAFVHIPRSEQLKLRRLSMSWHSFNHDPDGIGRRGGMTSRHVSPCYELAERWRIRCVGGVNLLAFTSAALLISRD